MRPDLLTVDSKKLDAMSREELVRAFEVFSRTGSELVAYFSALEARIVELSRELERSRRLAAIGEVAAMLAHEIRNPLAGMELSVSVLKRQGLDGYQRELLDNIHKGIKRLDIIISDILSFAQEISLKMAKTDIKELILSTVSSLSHRLEEKRLEVKIQSGLSVEDGYIMIDKGYMERVFVNVLDNAIDVSKEGGKLWINLWKTQDEMWISVEDEGPGFSESALERALEPFFTTKTTGTGLGLAICNRIVEAHGGRLILENTEKGGKVSICLPLS